MKKIIFTILFFMSCSIANATTWYIRDGGGTTTQCTGTNPAKYPGSGTGVACAYKNPLLVPTFSRSDVISVLGDSDISWNFTVSGVTTKPAVGDTYTVGGVTYTVLVSLPTGKTSGSIVMSGASAPAGTGSLVRSAGSGTTPIAYTVTSTAQAMFQFSGQGYNSGSLVMPSGTSGSPTTIIGTGTQYPQFWTDQYESMVINASTNHLLVENIDIATHNNCVTDGVVGPNGQTTGTPYNADGFPYVCTHGGSTYYESTGLELGGDDVHITNVIIHGMYNGIENKIGGGIVGNVTLTNVKVFGNSAQGFAIGENQSPDNVMTGTVVLQNSQVDFNGCGERYPLQDAADIQKNIATSGFSASVDNEANYYNCFGQDQGGYGDGVAWGPISSAAPAGNWTIIGTSISFNTQDGLDILHGSASGTIIVDRCRMEGNAGEQVKVTGLTEIIENSVINGDCVRWLNAPESSTTYGSVLGSGGAQGFYISSVNRLNSGVCRAYGGAISANMALGINLYIYNNTITGNGGLISTAQHDGSNCTSGGQHEYVYNNILYGGWTAVFDSSIAIPPLNTDRLVSAFTQGGTDGDGAGPCGPPGNSTGNGVVVPAEGYNLIYNTYGNNTGCGGTGDICGSSPLFTGTLKTGQNGSGIAYNTEVATYQQGVNVIALEYLQSGSPARNVGDTGLSYIDGTQDFNSYPQHTPNPDLGAFQFGSTPTGCALLSGSCASLSCCSPYVCNGSNVCVTQVCGDGLMPEGSKVCDTNGPNLNGDSCALEQYNEGGTLGCSAGCLSYDKSGCGSFTFPTTSVLDTFHRPNGVLGTNWGSITDMSIVNYAAVPSGSAITSEALWAASTFGVNEEAFMTIASKGTVGDASVGVRVDASTGYGYFFEPDVQMANSQYTCLYVSSGAGEVSLGCNSGITWATGDTFGISAYGNTIVAYREPSGSSTWTPIIFATDSTFSGASPNNHIAMSSWNGTGVPDITFNNFGGGTTVTSCLTDGTACTTSASCCNDYCNSSLLCASPVCGDGIMPEGSKVCDTNGPNVNGETCAQLGYITGTPGCNAGCGSFSTSTCSGLQPVVVQHVGHQTTVSATSISNTVAATGSGNLIIAVVGTTLATAVSDGTNSFTKFPGTPLAGYSVWYLSSSTAGKTSITATLSSSITTEMEVWEVSNMASPTSDTVGGVASGAQSGGIATGAPLTISNIPEFLIGVDVSSAGASNPSFTSGGDIIDGDSYSSLSTYTTGTFTPTWSDTGITFHSITASFKNGASCTSNGGACTTGSTCCSTYCAGSLCVACIPGNYACTTDASCCGGSCVAGFCTPNQQCSRTGGTSTTGGTYFN